MIRGMHAMFYSSEADALREFIRDQLGLAGTDVGGGWLIFDAPHGYGLVTFFKVPGDFKVQLYQAKYAK